MIFYFGLFEGAVHTSVQLILEPSWEHLYTFLTNRSFLVLVVFFFAVACVFHSKRLSEGLLERERFRRQYEEKFEEARKWRRVVEESERTRDREEVGNFDCLVTDRVSRELEEYEKNRKQPDKMTREELLEENLYLAADNRRLNELLEDEYRAQDETR